MKEVKASQSTRIRGKSLQDAQPGSEQDHARKLRGQKRFSMVGTLQEKARELLNPKGELATKFGVFLGADESVLDTFACAYYPPNSGLMVQGKMIVSQKYLAFTGGLLELRILLAFKDMSKMTKAATAMNLLQNAIEIHTKEYGSFFFGSFLDRDRTFYLLQSLIDIEKHAAEILAITRSGGMGSLTPLPEVQLEGVSQQNLEFGIQKSRHRSRSNTQSGRPPLQSKAEAPVVESCVTTDMPQRRSSRVDDVEGGCVISPVTTAGGLAPAGDSLLINLSKYGGVLLHDATCDLPLISIFSECVLYTYSYRDFLTCQGETDLLCSEWSPVLPAAAVLHDECGINFGYSRTLQYNHLRTFLPLNLFGLPKRAAASTTQYLYIFGRRGSRSRRPSKGASTTTTGDPSVTGGEFQTLATCRPLRCVLLSSTEYSSNRLLPYIDGFRVLTYWILEVAPAQSTRLRCVCRVVPNAGLRALRTTSLGASLSQLMFDGLTDRARLAAQAWHLFAVDRTREHIAESVSHGSNSGPKAGTVGGSSDLSVLSGNPSDQWSPREQQRILRLGRKLYVRLLVDILREQRSDSGFRKGNNSLTRLRHMAFLMGAILLFGLASALQFRANSHLSSRLQEISVQVDLVSEELNQSMRHQRELLKSLQHTSQPTSQPLLSPLFAASSWTLTPQKPSDEQTDESSELCDETIETDEEEK